MFKANRSTLQAYSRPIQYLPRRSAMTRPTHCQAGRQQQSGSARRGEGRGDRLLEADGAKLLPTVRSGKAGHNLASIHQMTPPKQGILIIALLLIYRP